MIDVAGYLVKLSGMLLTLFGFAVQAEKITFVTEDLPPLQIEQDTKPPIGAAVDIINWLINDAKLDATIKVYPWARSYEMALKEPNVVIFSILRSPDREPHFQWVGQIYTIRSYFAALKTRQDISISSIEDAKKYAVGSIRHDLAETYLLEKGFVPKKNLYVSSKYPILWQMLFSGRTDIAFTNSVLWQHEISHTGLDPQKVKLVYEIEDISSSLYIAASSTTSRTIVEKLTASLNKLKSSQHYHAILDKWQLPYEEIN
ncbi:substrate-binding periplasmic protein [Thalassotalea fusca]